jgi:O-methyltransferase involved in polyketide biosynthesis
MSSNDDVSSIADASRPNAGRIYDYLLGGNHNFEIDRQSAEQLKQIAPGTAQLVRIIRWFLGEAVLRLVSDGYKHFLDFASGLPTADHIHQIAPKGTKVIYSDIDPVTVSYAKEIIRDNPDVACVECDIREPGKLLNAGVVKQMFGKQRKIAIGMNGIAWFLDDKELAHALEVVYNWAGEGSKLFISDADSKRITKGIEAVFKFYKNVGQPVYARSLDTLTKLIGKWKIEEPAFLPLTEWIDIDKELLDTTYEDVLGGYFVGAILRK